MQKVFNRLTELDALRGVAALGVVWCHLTLNRPQGEHFFKYGFMGGYSGEADHVIHWQREQ